MNLYRNSVLLLVVLSLGLCSSHLFAWQTNGVAICTAANSQEYPTIVSDGSGGAVITWLDDRNGGSTNNIYAQRVDSTGSTLWTTNGVAICTVSNGQVGQTLVNDGSGGAIITWEDYRSGSTNNIYAQRVNSTGSTLWTTNGIAICTASIGQAYPSIVSDGVGGAIITWEDYRNGSYSDIYAQRVDSIGSTLWTLNGVAVCTAYLYHQFPTSASNGSGGAIITWTDNRYETTAGGFYDIFAQAVDSNGSTYWTLNGVQMSTSGSGYTPQITSDQSGGGIVIWYDTNNMSINAQRVNSTGSTLWAPNGVAFCTTQSEFAALGSDGSNGAIITWQDGRSGTYNIYAQRVNSSGSTFWIDNGVAICTANSGGPMIVSDGSGGAIITWGDERSGTTVNIYAQRVDSTGSTLWITNGVAICTAASDQELPMLVSNGSGGAIITWMDYRSSVYDSHIYAQSITSSGSTFIPVGETPPILSNPPALKAFIGVGLTTVFNLEDYNSGGLGTSYSIPTDFLSLGTTNGSYEGQTNYDTATTGTNTYEISNTAGSSTASGLVKYSTYRIRKLPHVGLTVGSSWDVNMGNYTYNTSGLALPPSFGNPTALNISDFSKVTAYWVNDSVIRITSLQSFAGAVDVDVTASPIVPAGTDQDKERIQVYTNLLPNSTFSTANDISSGTYWGGSALEIPPGRTTLATENWVSSYTDSAGTQESGVVQFTFADANGGVKATPGVSNWIDITNGDWYIYRMHLVADSTNNSHQSFLYGYTNIPAGGVQTDVAANILFGVPTVWTWQETPLLAHGSGTTGYPQIQLKAGGAGSIYVDEVQIINATPALLEARSNTKSHYLYGQFTTGNDTTGWGQQLYVGAGSAPEISVNDGLELNFVGAGPGIAQEGIKWTANNDIQGSGHAYSFPVNVNHDMNIGLTLSISSGSFNSLGLLLLAAYGVQTSGQQNIGVIPSNLIASAGVGIINSGNYYAEGYALNPYYQGQFGIRSDLAGILIISDVDVSSDHDDPNFGDATLFP